MGVEKWGKVRACAFVSECGKVLWAKQAMCSERKTQVGACEEGTGADTKANAWGRSDSSAGRCVLERLQRGVAPEALGESGPSVGAELVV